MYVLKSYYSADTSRESANQTCHGQSVHGHEMERSVRQKRLARLTIQLKCTLDSRQFCHVADNASECKLGSFQDADFAGYLADSKSTSGGMLYVFDDHTLVPISSACEQHAAVSDSSTSAEVIHQTLV